MGWQRKHYERLHRQGGEAEAALFDAFGHSSCPRCSLGRIAMFGRELQRVRCWRCNACGCTFIPTSKTIFKVGHNL